MSTFESHTFEPHLLVKKEKDITPQKIVAELNKYIIGQDKAKRAVAIALRNRVRRMLVDEEIRNEITPKNILMIGPTGVGKTEIARRLANFAKAPFIKVEATKFTEVGFVGRDVESIIRDLLEASIKLTREQALEKVKSNAEHTAEELILDVLLPQPKTFESNNEDEEEYDDTDSSDGSDTFLEDDILKSNENEDKELTDIKKEKSKKTEKTKIKNTDKFQTTKKTKSQKKDNLSATREVLRKKLRSGELDDKEIEIRIAHSNIGIEIMAPPGMEEMTSQLQSLFQNISGERRKVKKLKVKDAFRIIRDEEAAKLINEDEIRTQAIDAVEQQGIVFLDEIDKVTQRSERVSGADVSREGVQRDLLPLIEGSSVSTKYGMVRTDHILFIASGAFHFSKPSDLIPELQGRLPIRVELDALKTEDFMKILVEPNASLTEQYQALLKTEGIILKFKKDGIEKIAQIAWKVNEKTENIGARRLHTVVERLLEDVSFRATALRNKEVIIDAIYVEKQLKDIHDDEDLSKFIL